MSDARPIKRYAAEAEVDNGRGHANRKMLRTTGDGSSGLQRKGVRRNSASETLDIQQRKWQHRKDPNTAVAHVIRQVVQPKSKASDSPVYDAAMEELKDLQSLGLVLPNPAYLIGASLFGLIGYAAFRRGRKTQTASLTGPV